jgi:hypothetical protein
MRTNSEHTTMEKDGESEEGEIEAGPGALR